MVRRPTPSAALSFFVPLSRTGSATPAVVPFIRHVCRRHRCPRRFGRACMHRVFPRQTTRFNLLILMTYEVKPNDQELTLLRLDLPPLVLPFPLSSPPLSPPGTFDNFRVSRRANRIILVPGNGTTVSPRFSLSRI